MKRKIGKNPWVYPEGYKKLIMKSNAGCNVRVKGTFQKYTTPFVGSIHSSQVALGRRGRERPPSSLHLIDLDFFMIPHFFISRSYRWLLAPPVPLLVLLVYTFQRPWDPHYPPLPHYPTSYFASYFWGKFQVQYFLQVYFLELGSHDRTVVFGGFV